MLAFIAMYPRTATSSSHGPARDNLALTVIVMARHDSLDRRLVVRMTRARARMPGGGNEMASGPGLPWT